MSEEVVQTQKDELAETEAQLASMSASMFKTDGPNIQQVETESPAKPVPSKPVEEKAKEETTAGKSPEPPGKVETEAVEKDNPHKEGTPDYKAWERNRKAAKEWQGRYEADAKKWDEDRKALEARLAAIEQRSPAAPAPQQVPDAEVFRFLVKAGKNELGGQSQTVKQSARMLIGAMKPAQIMSIIDRADSGEFGDESVDIGVQARDALLRANAVAFQQQESYAQQAQTTAEYAGKVDASAERALAKYPELSPDSNSDLSKYAATWRLENLGVNDKGEMVNKDAPLSWMVSPHYVNEHPEWPERFAELVHRDYLRDKAVSATASAEKETKKKEAQRQPESGAARSPQSAAGSESQQIESLLRNTSVMSRLPG